MFTRLLFAMLRLEEPTRQASELLLSQGELVLRNRARVSAGSPWGVRDASLTRERYHHLLLLQGPPMSHDDACRQVEDRTSQTSQSL